MHNNKEYLDPEYKKLCASEWAKGSSHFCYNSNNPSSLASCCRVLNEMTDNTFSSTTGMTGIMTGSCNVITLNLNRIIQEYFRWFPEDCNINCYLEDKSKGYPFLKKWLTTILERVYKYHIAYKTMLYDMEDAGMFAASNGGYIYMKKLFSTIGIIGYAEAAQFLGMKVGNNEEYISFMEFLGNTNRECNREHSIHDKKRPFIFNLEAIPGESLGVKLYKWDKEDGYWVPEDQVLYNCYFYNPWDNTSILDKMKLHGSRIVDAMSGGQAAHLNLDAHLSEEQYLHLLDVAKDEGTNYFTFNIPMSECKDCGHVVNAPVKECPKCGSKRIKYWTRIIGYLTAVESWSMERAEEFTHRIYSHNI